MLENTKPRISESAKDNIRALAKHGPGTIQEWQTHAKVLKRIADIRNRFAHGSKNKRISYQNKEQLLQILFGEGGFLRIIRISQDKTEW